MRISIGILLGCGLLGITVLCAEEPAPLAKKAAAELKEYYEESARHLFVPFPPGPPRAKPKPPPWEESLKRLAAKDDAVRREASAHLCELLSRSLQDQLSGAVRWRPSPFLAGQHVNPAVMARQSIAERIAEMSLAPEALPIVRWYLDKELIPEVQAAAATALGTMNTEEADTLRAAVAGKPHPNAAVEIETLKQILQRKKTIPAEKLASLCQHYRSDIRDVARKLNQQQGGADPGPFDAIKALRSKPIRDLMDKITPLILNAPPEKAKFVAVTEMRADPDGARAESWVIRGWLLSETENKIGVLTPFGRREVFDKHPASGPNTFGKAPTWHTVAALEPRGEVERIEKLRTKDFNSFAFSDRGGLTGQFKGHGASLYEIMFGHWLFTTKQDALAARILLPAIESQYLDDQLVRIARNELGDVLGQQMLVAFVGDRDYPKAQRLASLLAERFPETRFHEYGVRLAKQLPKRADDFNKLKLPSAKEWATLKPTMKRPEQIAYLCDRMRLLNSFQWGQIGLASYSDKQYAEPCGMSENAAWSEDRGKTEVINPLVELIGPVDGIGIEEKEQPRGLDPTVADIQYLAAYLKDDWYLLMVSFHRDSSLDRHLHSSRGLFAAIINKIARQELCQPDRFGSMTEPEQDDEIKRIVAWSKENAGQSGPGR